MSSFLILLTAGETKFRFYGKGLSQKRTAMTRHSTDFEAEKALPADTAQKLIPSPSPAAEIAEPETKAAKNGGFRRLLMAGAAIAVLAGASWYGWDYWTVARFQVSTDDAYVKADNTTIAPRVSGYLTDVLVGDNERVKAGQVLAHRFTHDARLAMLDGKAFLPEDSCHMSSETCHTSLKAITAGKSKIIGVARVCSTGRLGEPAQAAVETVAA